MLRLLRNGGLLFQPITNAVVRLSAGSLEVVYFGIWNGYGIQMWKILALCLFLFQLLLLEEYKAL